MRNFNLLIGNYLALFPKLFTFLVKTFGHKKLGRKIIDDSCKFVIEGFPRTANTFALHAFLLSQKKEWGSREIAHHVHKSSQVIIGLKKGLPVLVLIRDPSDAIVSAKIRQPSYSFPALIKAYILFYRPLLKYKNELVFADFNEVIADFGVSIARVNKLYGTKFDLFENTKKNIDTLNRKIKELDDVKSSANPELRVSVPSEQKNHLKLNLHMELANHRKQLKKAKKIYSELVNSIQDSNSIA